MSHGLPVIVAQGDGTQDDLVREETAGRSASTTSRVFYPEAGAFRMASSAQDGRRVHRIVKRRSISKRWSIRLGKNSLT